MGIFGWTVLGLAASGYLPGRRKGRPSGVDVGTLRRNPASGAAKDSEAPAQTSGDGREG